MHRTGLPVFQRVYVKTFLAALLLCCSCAGQAIPEKPRPMRWDGTHGVIAFGSGIVEPENLPIRTYAEGRQRGGDIDLFRDFPTLKRALVKDIGAGPDGTTILAAWLQDRQNQYLLVILTFNEAGYLSKSWNTYPYNPEGIAVDDDGSIYMVGFRVDAKRGGPSYPLLIHYSNDGRVIGEGLPSGTFSKQDEAIYGAELVDRPIVTLRNGQLLIYAPAGREIVVCTKEGRPIKRLELIPILQNITKGDHLDTFEVHGFAFLGNNHAVVNVFEADSEGRPALPSSRVINISTGIVKTLESGKSTWPLIGATDRELIYLRGNGSELVMEKRTLDTLK